VRLRSVGGLFLIKVGRFVQLLAIMVMKPRDLVEFSRRYYRDTKSLERYGRTSLIEAGLTALERSYLDQLPEKRGRLLLLGLGGGREAIALARMGFEITGVDFSSEMVEKAKENTRRYGVEISALVQDFTNLDLPENSYDIAWLSAITYSAVPTRKWRVETLRRIINVLRPGGHFICEFLWSRPPSYPFLIEFLRKALALITLGYTRYEKGDMLWDNQQFLHAFYSEKDVLLEFSGAGFETVFFKTPENYDNRGRAVLRKPLCS
jgi:SAM-dependent methyltransferase